MTTTIKVQFSYQSKPVYMLTWKRLSPEMAALLGQGQPPKNERSFNKTSVRPGTLGTIGTLEADIPEDADDTGVEHVFQGLARTSGPTGGLLFSERSQLGDPPMITDIDLSWICDHAFPEGSPIAMEITMSTDGGDDDDDDDGDGDGGGDDDGDGDGNDDDDDAGGDD